LYRLLAAEYSSRIPWPDVEVFWADERYVPRTSPHSNYGMVKRELLDHVACPQENVHPMPVSYDSPEAAALEYERTLRLLSAEGPAFDVVLLGLGQDGHTASLFPGSSSPMDSTRWVIPSTAPVPPTQRLTLTLRALTAGAQVDVIVSGSAKASALAYVLGERADPLIAPAAGLLSTSGTLVWWADQAAAAQLPGRAPVPPR